jgi:hypothetical protein
MNLMTHDEVTRFDGILLRDVNFSIILYREQQSENQFLLEIITYVQLYT